MANYRYPIFSESQPKTIILSEWVETTWVSKMIEHYESLGYEYTKTNKKFWVKPEHLTRRSTVKVLVKCPLCKESRRVSYYGIKIAGHSYCMGCSKICDISGIRFGRLVALHPVFNHGKSGTIWLCKCDCGNETEVFYGSLVHSYEKTRSCGCLARERSSDSSLKVTGSLHPQWNPHLTQEERIANRDYTEYIEWRSSVYERDNYTCQVCLDSGGGNLVSHHLYNYSDFPEYRTDIDNGITLCSSCHDGFHIWMGGHMKPCTAKDFSKWFMQNKIVNQYIKENKF